MKRRARLSDFQQASTNPTRIAAVCAACSASVTRTDACRRHVPRIGVVDLCRGCASDTEAIEALLPRRPERCEAHA
jgi:hypothetical protein